MDEKNKVINFNEIKNKTKDSNTEPKSNNNQNTDKFKEILGNMGVELDKDMIETLSKSMESKEMKDLLDKLDLNNLNLENIGDLSKEVKSMEKKYRQQQMSHRAFGQWISFHKPYKFENLYPIEFLKEIASFLDLGLPQRLSKNETIDFIKPHMVEYLNEVLRLISKEDLSYLGQVIYHEGVMEFDKILKETEELKIDFFVSRCLISRVKSNNINYLIIPQEVMVAVEKLNFNDINKYNDLNTKLIKLTIGYVNSYGIIPFDLLEEKVYSLISEQITNIMDRAQFKNHLNKLCEFSFPKSILDKKIYSNIVMAGEYVHHGLVGVIQNLIDIQNESITSYKEYDIEELYHRGDSFYYEESLALSRILEIIESHNKISEVQKEELKNMIFTFSKIEFEPSFILNMLGMNYILPDGILYQSFLESIRAYYSNSEKWILKGYTPSESNKDRDDSVSKFDPRKILNIEFTNK